ncbi:MAG TPA: alkaline phosphatase family protein [Planctomycetota bacterium]
MSGLRRRASFARAPLGAVLRSGLAVALSVLAACGGADSPPYQGSPYEGPPILVIGMDGLDWKVLEPLMAAGRAPNFAALVARGIGGDLETDIPTMSPVIWTSIATGVKAESHGIRYFSEVGENGYPIPNGLPYTSNSRKVPAVWNIAAAHGRDVLSVAWWVSWPAEDVGAGRVVASYAAQMQGQLLWKPGVWREGLPELTWPRGLQDDLRPYLEAGGPGGPASKEFAARFAPVPTGWNKEAKQRGLFHIVWLADRTHLAIARDQIREHPADLNMVYFGLPDVAGHFWWAYREPGAMPYPLPAPRVAALADWIDRSYEAADAWLGELLAAAPENALVMVISDHGMHANPAATPENPQSGSHEDAPPGVILIAGPGIPARGLLPAGERRIGSVYDVTPTLLDWLGLGRPPDMDGESLRAWMSPAWRAAHPLEDTASFATGFRAATGPCVPIENANELFQESIMNELGYVDAELPGR